MSRRDLKVTDVLHSFWIFLYKHKTKAWITSNMNSTHPCVTPDIQDRDQTILVIFEQIPPESRFEEFQSLFRRIKLVIIDEISQTSASGFEIRLRILFGFVLRRIHGSNGQKSHEKKMAIWENQKIKN